LGPNGDELEIGQDLGTDAPTGRFPALRTRNLDGAEVVLPDDLPGPLDLLVLAFRRRQQGDVDAWRSAIDAEWRHGLDFWEVPVIGRGWGPVRGWIDGGMAAAIPSPDVRAHTLTTYTDVGAVREALGIAGSGQVVAVLVADGVVRWQSAGPPNRERMLGLRAALERLMPR
jgi:hypothetical protein